MESPPASALWVERTNHDVSYMAMGSKRAIYSVFRVETWWSSTKVDIDAVETPRCIARRVQDELGHLPRIGLRRLQVVPPFSALPPRVATAVDLPCEDSRFSTQTDESVCSECMVGYTEAILRESTSVLSS